MFPYIPFHLRHRNHSNNMNIVLPVGELSPKEIASEKYKKNRPYYPWGKYDRNSVLSYSNQSFHNIQISFSDHRYVTNCIWFTIEIPQHTQRQMQWINKVLFGKKPEEQIPMRPELFCGTILPLNSNIAAIGFFFERNPQTGKVNMTLREKYFHGQDRCVIYYDCNYFGLDYEYVYSSLDEIPKKESKFVVSNSWQDKAIASGLNLYHPEFEDFQYIVEIINDFIQENRGDEIPVALPCLNCGHKEKPTTVAEDSVVYTSYVEIVEQCGR